MAQSLNSPNWGYFPDGFFHGYWGSRAPAAAPLQAGLKFSPGGGGRSGRGPVRQLLDT